MSGDGSREGRCLAKKEKGCGARYMGVHPSMAAAQHQVLSLVASHAGYERSLLPQVFVTVSAIPFLLVNNFAEYFLTMFL